MKLRLVAGTINDPPLEDGWRSFTLDIENRGVWNRDLDMAVQPDFVADIASLPIFRDDMFDEIRIHHVLEHLHPERARVAIGELRRILKADGVLDVEVPDIARVCAAYTAGDLDHAGVSQWLYGEQLPNHTMADSHRSAWTEALLDEALTAAGLHAGEALAAGLACRFRAVKP